MSCAKATSPFKTCMLGSDPDYAAPDGSEIRVLPTMVGGGLCHCTLPMGKTSLPVQHHRVEEIWYIIKGEGEVWRKAGQAEETVRVCAGTSLTIPQHTAFQFRNTGVGPLSILITTMPPWKGPQDAQAAIGAWPAAASPGSAPAD